MPMLESLNKNPKVATVTLVVLLLAAGGLIASSLRSGQVQTTADAQAFYTVDDGATWFADSPKLIPPFDHGGKSAVRAFVFQGEQGRKFVGYLMRYSDAAKKAISANPQFGSALPGGALEYKKPLGASKWVLQGTKDASDVQKVIDAGGQKELTVVNP